MGQDPLQSEGWNPADRATGAGHVAEAGRTAGPSPTGAAVPGTGRAGSRWPTGVVRALRERTEQRGWGHQMSQTHVVTFRVERFDPAGRQLTPIPVEMRGKRFYGSLSDGDWVQVRSRWRPGRHLTVRKVRNLTVSGTFRARRWSGGMVATAVVFLLVLAAALAIFINVLSGMVGGPGIVEPVDPPGFGLP